MNLRQKHIGLTRPVRLLIALITLGILPALHAADRYVAVGGSDSNNDCTDVANPCATIQNALTQDPSGVVHVGPGSFTEGAIVFTGDGTVTGAPNNGTTVTADFQVSNSNRNVTLQNLTIMAAATQTYTGLFGATSIAVGGTTHLTVDGCAVVPLTGTRIFGVYRTASLTIISSVLMNGSAIASSGGAIYDSGTLSMSGTLVSGCTAGSGGAVLVHTDTPQFPASATITNCSFDTNTALFNGGAIFNAIDSTLAIYGSTFTTNSATTGGAIYDFAGAVSVSNSTFSGNTATGSQASSGGGIYNVLGTLRVNSSTLNNNSATGFGGAISDDTSTLVLNNTILAGSTSGGDFFEGTPSLSAVSGTNDFIQDGSSLSLFANSLSGDPKLGPLQNNGGPTLTYGLPSDSTAINAGADETPLSAGIDNSPATTNVPVGDAGGFVVGEVIQIDAEQMLVTASDGSTNLTVTRGANGTGLAAHNAGIGVNPAFDQRGPGFARRVANAFDIGAYELKQVTISATALPNGAGTVTGGGVFLAGSQVQVVAVPNTCSNFTNWTENNQVVSTSATYTFTATADRNLVAHFVIKTYSISASASPPTGGTITGTGIHPCGSTVTLVATPNNSKPNISYRFINWTENTVQVSTSATYNFTAAANRALVAHFQTSSTATPTVNVTVSPNQITEGHSATFTISVSPADHSTVTVNYQFTGTAKIGGDYTLNASPTSITIPAFQPTATIVLQSVKDNQKESAETAIMTFTKNSAYKTGSSGSATVKIIDN